MDTTESQKSGVIPVVIATVLLLGIGLVIGLAKLLEEAPRRMVKMPVQDMVNAMAQSIQLFRMDYGRWPDGERERYQSDAAFLTHLLGRDKRKNKRGRNFLYTLPVLKSGEPKGGIVMTGISGELFDTWGNYFVIALDHDGDGWVENPEGPSGRGPAKLNLQVAVVSPGPDGVLSGKNREGKDATEDNSRSWPNNNQPP